MIVVRLGHLVEHSHQKITTVLLQIVKMDGLPPLVIWLLQQMVEKPIMKYLLVRA